jgi:S-DNA-T family DNA segregation ATPase FtsK/SpoIIIE
VADLALALARFCDERDEFASFSGRPRVSETPELWLAGFPLDPSIRLVTSGIRDGSWLGLGGPPPGHGASTRPGIAEIRVVGGPDCGLVVPVDVGRYVIGRGSGDISLTDTNVTRSGHCVIVVTATAGAPEFGLQNLDDKNGTGIDGQPVGHDPEPVRPGQLIAVGSSLLAIAVPDDERAVTQPGNASDPLGRRLNRPPRMSTGVAKRIVLDFVAEPVPRQRISSWLVALIAPAVSIVAGLSVALFTGQWFFLLIGLGGFAVPLVTQVTSSRGAKQSSRQAQRDFKSASATLNRRLTDLLFAEQQRRRAELPDPAELLMIAAGPGVRLWERLPDDDDFLQLRVGWADLPADSVEIRRPAGELPAEPAPEPETVVRQVPASIALPAVGVFGVAAKRDTGRALLAWAVCQTAVLHSPADVQLVLLTRDPQAWEWIRWLPHLRPLPGSGALAAIGTDKASCADRVAELKDLVGNRLAASQPRESGHRAALPAVLVVLDGSYRLRQLAGLDSVLADGASVGVYSICLDEDRNQLPRECRAELIVDRAGRRKATLRDQRGIVDIGKIDEAGADWADQVARALAPIRASSADGQGDLPDQIRILDLWRMSSPTSPGVAGKWASAGRTTAVPIGWSQTGTFVLDIARNGPHMLVAGTTGAGKSEFLQALVASLAIGNSPQAMVFILIDYKGGSAFARCTDLPHVVGYLTDLDEHLAVRALKSLTAESEYRERMLLAAGCKDIEAYHAAGEPRGPLPRLLLAIDEFRFLAEKMPDFLGRLADVVARGRSLGIHLVLATQRPAGVVTGDIRANAGLRVCFRVEDPDDSTVVIDVPDACLIEKKSRGRGYVRTERGAFTPFQGGYVGGLRPDLPAELASLTVTERPISALGAAVGAKDAGPSARSVDEGSTDLAALVSAIAATGQLPPPHRPWLDPLEPAIALGELRDRHARDPRTGIVFGLQDRPDRQIREEITFRLDQGSHLLVVGPAQSGRTTLLRTIAAGLATDWSPADAHLYILDCDAGGLAPLARLPHCGAVVRRTERERAGRLLDRLAAELGRRQDLIAGRGYASVTEQRRAAPAAERLPYLVLMLDRWEGFLADLGLVDNGRLLELVLRLLNEGASAGLRVIITGDRTALSRLPSSMPSRLALRMTDPNDLAHAGAPRDAMPADPPPGRGITLPGGVEFQVAFVGLDADGAQQNAALESIIKEAVEAHPVVAPAPFRVDQLPRRVTAEVALTLDENSGSGLFRPVVAVGGDELRALRIDLNRFPAFAIAGPLLSGRSTALLVTAQSLVRDGASILCLAPRESPLRRLDGSPGVLAVLTSDNPSQTEVVRLLDAAPGPVAVLVDDAEALSHAPIGELLAQVPTEGRTRGHALVIAGTSSEFQRYQRGFTAAARQYKCGLLLTPESPMQGHELFVARLPRSGAFDGPEGRGYLITTGQPLLVQVPEAAE